MKILLLSIILLSAVNSYSQNVNIPDSNFKNYLVNSTSINTNGDSEIQVTEASAYTGIIYCSGLAITDLTGIEAFTAIYELYCENNLLTSLDVSGCDSLGALYCDNNYLTSLDLSSNTALTFLYCGDNQLTSLDVSGLTNLYYFFSTGNQITSLDLSSNTSLEYLICNAMLLTSLDVSSNTALTHLYCGNNQLTSLDLSSNTALEYAHCGTNQLECLNVKNGNNTNFYTGSGGSNFVAYNNPNLTCIEVDVPLWANTYLSLYCDPLVSFSEDCNYTCSNTASISELNNTSKQLIKIVDLMGRETNFKPNTPLIYIYSDGAVERVFKLEY